jgi:hypothetical protein
MYIHIYIYTYVYVYVYINIHMCVCVYIYIYIYNIYTYTYIYIYNTYIQYIYIYMCVCVCVCIVVQNVPGQKIKPQHELACQKKKANKESESSALLSLPYKVKIKSTFEYRHEVCECVGVWVGGCVGVWVWVGGWSSWDGGFSR